MIYELAIQIEELRTELRNAENGAERRQIQAELEIAGRADCRGRRGGRLCRKRAVFLRRFPSSVVFEIELPQYSNRSHFIGIGNDADRASCRNLIPAEFTLAFGSSRRICEHPLRQAFSQSQIAFCNILVCRHIRLASFPVSHRCLPSFIQFDQQPATRRPRWWCSSGTGFLRRRISCQRGGTRSRARSAAARCPP